MQIFVCKMQHIVVRKRALIPGGLWTPKVHGEFDEGDPAKTSFFIAGQADIKEMSGQLKLFFNDVRLINRQDKVAQEGEEKLKETNISNLCYYYL